jgi:hypothetical protein
MNEHHWNEVAFILVPVLFTTILSVAMSLAAHLAEDTAHGPMQAHKDNGEEAHEEFACAVVSHIYSCSVEQLIVQQEVEIKHLSTHVVELLEEVKHLTRVVNMSEHSKDRFLSKFTHQGMAIEDMCHRLDRIEDTLDVLMDRAKEQEKEQNERLRQERAEKRRGGVWKFVAGELERVGGEAKIESEEDDGGFEHVYVNGENAKSLSEGEMDEYQDFRPDGVYSMHHEDARSQSPLSFVDGLHVSDCAKTDRYQGGQVSQGEDGPCKHQTARDGISQHSCMRAAPGKQYQQHSAPRQWSIPTQHEIQ